MRKKEFGWRQHGLAMPRACSGGCVSSDPGTDPVLTLRRLLLGGTVFARILIVAARCRDDTAAIATTFQTLAGRRLPNVTHRSTCR